jgi:hypothetical protein
MLQMIRRIARRLLLWAGLVPAHDVTSLERRLRKALEHVKALQDELQSEQSASAEERRAWRRAWHVTWLRHDLEYWGVPSSDSEGPAEAAAAVGGAGQPASERTEQPEQPEETDAVAAPPEPDGGAAHRPTAAEPVPAATPRSSPAWPGGPAVEPMEPIERADPDKLADEAPSPVPAVASRP